MGAPPPRTSGVPRSIRVIFLSLQRALFFEGLRSARRLMRVVADRRRLRWYLGNDLAEVVPDHSGFTRFGDRHGEAVAFTNPGVITQQVGRLTEAISLFDRNLTIRRQMDDRRGWPWRRGIWPRPSPNPGRSRAAGLCQESLRLRRELDDKPGIASCVEWLGTLASN